MQQNPERKGRDPRSTDFTVVVVDDSVIYRKLIKNTLAEAEYTIFFARTGSEALDLVAKHSPGVLITAWEMPDLTGPELCKQVRRNQKSYTHIILLTSNQEKEHVIQGLAAGADDYLTKPFHSGELFARVAVGRRVAGLHEQIRAKNKLLEELALTDSLSGLPNRRAIEEWAGRELKGAIRHGFEFWLVMADLDHFKAVNDTYGHEAGDIVLRKFSEMLRANTRASNMSARIGGEEFVMALTHTDKPGVEVAAERLRAQVESQQFTFVAKRLQVTASFGVSGLNGRNNLEFDQLLREADTALYMAKKNGRNCVSFN